MAVEGAGRRELAEFVADHVLGHQDRDEFVAVVDAEGQPDELREDRRAPRPGADHLVAARAARLLRLLQQIAVDERAFPYRACHAFSPSKPASLRGAQRRGNPDRRAAGRRDCFALLAMTRGIGMHVYRVCWRRRRISRSVALLARVFLPLVGLPHGVTGWRPPEDLPSPPPCGWSIGFMATPRTDGRLPFHRIRPALPQLMFDCSALPTSPTVARQRASTLRISPDGIRSCAMPPSLATSWTAAPA